MTDRLLTPSKITAWLDCAHYLTLKHQVEDGTRSRRRTARSARSPSSCSTKGLAARGRLPGRVRTAGPVDPRGPGQDATARDVRGLGRTGRQPVRPGLRRHLPDAVRPRRRPRHRRLPDPRRRIPTPASSRYEPVDAKLARVEAKPGHVLQLCFYADAIEAATGARPQPHAPVARFGPSRDPVGPTSSALLEPPAGASWPTSLDADPADDRHRSRAVRALRSSASSSSMCDASSGATRTRSSTSPASARAERDALEADGVDDPGRARRRATMPVDGMRRRAARAAGRARPTLQVAGPRGSPTASRRRSG